MNTKAVSRYMLMCGVGADCLMVFKYCIYELLLHDVYHYN